MYYSVRFSTACTVKQGDMDAKLCSQIQSRTNRTLDVTGENK